jgi:hypothetical protein
MSIYCMDREVALLINAYTLLIINITGREHRGHHLPGRQYRSAQAPDVVRGTAGVSCHRKCVGKGPGTEPQIQVSVTNAVTLFRSNRH